jgi:ABC-type Fe3+-siderophore transport system permease subunit
MQTIFRNPLADPSVLGISAGASLGFALVVMGSSALGLSFLGNQFSMVLAALAGSMLVLMLVMAVSMRFVTLSYFDSGNDVWLCRFGSNQHSAVFSSEVYH